MDTIPAPTAQPWALPGWDESAFAWIHARLDQLGLPPTGPIREMHRRNWSAVFTIPTRSGTVYFKATAPHCSNEAAITHRLYALRPDCITTVLAVDPQRRFLLMADEGDRLRTRMPTPPGPRAAPALAIWERLLSDFAELQIEMISRAQQLLDLGIIDHRLDRLPHLFAGLIADDEVLRLGLPDGLSAEQRDRLAAFQPRYAEFCAWLSAAPIAETLHHDDFHDGNVFIRGDRLTFSDWGDSCLAFPFFSIVITLRSASDRLGMPDEATENPDRLPPELLRLRDAYLEPWTRFLPAAELRAIFPTAWRAAMVNRALGWANEYRHMPPAARAEYGYIVPAWLGEFLLAVKE